MSLRFRSAAAASAATLIALVILGSGVDLLVARHLHRGLDRTLHARAVEVAQLSASAPALLTTPGSLDSPVGAAQAMVEVVDARGRLVARSLSLRGRVLSAPLAAAAVRRGVSGFGTLHLGGDTLRYYAAPLATGNGPAAGGAVVVAASTHDLTDTIDTLRALTLAGALVAAAIGGLASALLMRGALRPLVRLDRAALEIERTGDATRRLPGPARDDEVGRLATTLNAMLESLARAREGERRFLADASHELRTPLTALRGNVDHLARHGATPELVRDLEADADRLARLADDLLALSREEASPPPSEVVPVHELARAAGADEVEAEEAAVLGDRAALERALANLVDNARRHGAGAVTVAVRREGGRVLLTVADQGEGVGAADRERVFERFHGDGTGLGLAIVRATAERHGGSVSADGARFTIELPALRNASESLGKLRGEDLEKGLP